MADSGSIKTRLKDENFWLRLPFMLLFFFAWKIAELVLIGVILIQVIFRLFTGAPQPNLLALGSQLTRYTFQLFRYLTFNTDTKPFPFADWPSTESQDLDPYHGPETKPEPKDETSIRQGAHVE